MVHCEAASWMRHLRPCLVTRHMTCPLPLGKPCPSGVDFSPVHAGHWPVLAAWRKSRNQEVDQESLSSVPWRPCLARSIQPGRWYWCPGEQPLRQSIPESEVSRQDDLYPTATAATSLPAISLFSATPQSPLFPKVTHLHNCRLLLQTQVAASWDLYVSRFLRRLQLYCCNHNPPPPPPHHHHLLLHHSHPHNLSPPPPLGGRAPSSSTVSSSSSPFSSSFRCHSGPAVFTAVVCKGLGCTLLLSVAAAAAAVRDMARARGLLKVSQPGDHPGPRGVPWPEPGAPSTALCQAARGRTSRSRGWTAAGGMMMMMMAVSFCWCGHLVGDVAWRQRCCRCCCCCCCCWGSLIVPFIFAGETFQNIRLYQGPLAEARRALFLSSCFLSFIFGVVILCCFFIFPFSRAHSLEVYHLRRRQVAITFTTDPISFGTELMSSGASTPASAPTKPPFIKSAFLDLVAFFRWRSARKELA